jgi:hypothetical protein
MVTVATFDSALMDPVALSITIATIVSEAKITPVWRAPC